MIWNRRINVNGVNLRIFQQFVIIIISFFNLERIAQFIQILLISLTNGIHISVRVSLINGNKFRSKAKTYNRNVNFFHKIKDKGFKNVKCFR